jgi:hypothetical protein
MRKLCVVATHHEFQMDSPMDFSFDRFLRDLIRLHKVDVILEEATGLPPKACVEVLADRLNLPWMNVDLDVESRKLVPDSSATSMFGSFQDLVFHAQRENVWVVKTSGTVTNSGLLICGLCHVFSFSEKLRWLDFEVEAHVYDPSGIYDWSGRKRVSAS